MPTHMILQRSRPIHVMKERLLRELKNVKWEICQLGNTTSPRELAFLQGRLCTLEWSLKLFVK